jgi:phage terminase large subunit-like protein
LDKGIAFMDRNKLLNIATAIKAFTEHKKYNLIDSVFPLEGPFSRVAYAKHWEFFKAGATHRFRVLGGGNGSGKSFTGATELAYHMTGEYPEGWEGYVFKKAIKVWVVCESGSLWRDSMQQALLGSVGEELGTGLIKKDVLHDTKSMPGVPGALGQIQVKHKDGGTSSVTVKTFEMGRNQFQAATLDLLIFDEEPPEDIYAECIMRTRGVKGVKRPGIVMMMFTPLKGLSEVVMRYLPNGRFPPGGTHPEHPDRYAIAISWDDAPHLTEEDKATMIAEMPPNERDARTKGIPALGSGRIYPISEDDFVVTPLEIPEYFPQAYSLDFGWNNTAVVWMAQDPVTQIIYVYSEYKRGKLPDSQHAYAIKERGDWMSGAADPSGGGRRDDGKMRIDYFRTLGLDLHPGYNSLITGIAQVYNMLESGMLKIFSNLTKILDEIRVYRYDSKDPNKPARSQDDHLLDALRYGISIFEMIAVSHYDAEMAGVDSYDEHRDHGDIDSLTGY